MTTRADGGADGEEAEGRQPAGAGRAVLPDATADAPLRAEPDPARQQRRAQHQVQPRLAVHGGRAAGQGRLHRRAGNQPRRAAPRTHRVRPDRRWPARAARLAARASRAAAARVPALRGGAVADRGAATGRGSHAAAPPAGPARRAARRDPGPGQQHGVRGRAPAVPGRGGIPARSAGRRLSVHRAVHRPDKQPGNRLGPAVGPIPRRALQHRQHRRKAQVMTRTRTALIIGGGIAGPATAMALHKAGIDPVVYEAHPTSADGIGVFLTLASNGVAALRVLGADEPALAAGFPTPGITLRSGTGKRLGQTRTGGSLPDGTVSQTIKRADLYRVLHQEASSRGVRIERGKRLIAAEDTGDGVRAVFADGSEAAGDVLIGCDGVHSAVRPIIDAAAPAPAYAGLLNTGGYARGVRVDTAPGSYKMIFGRRAFFGYATAPDGEVCWFANVPRRDEPARGQAAALTGDQWRPRLLQLFADDAGPAIALIEATPQIMTMSPIHTIAHLPTWHNGRMIVIGDAAHAPSPTSGH